MSNDDARQPAELRQFLERYPDTRQLELLQPDMLGILRGKRVGRDEFAKVFGKGVNFCGATVLLDSKGQTFERIADGSREEIQTHLHRRAGSLAPVPWAQVPTAQVLLAMATAQGEPFFADPRQVLRRRQTFAGISVSLPSQQRSWSFICSKRTATSPHRRWDAYRDAPGTGWAQYAAWRTSKLSTLFLRSCMRSARRRKFLQAPR